KVKSTLFQRSDRSRFDVAIVVADEKAICIGKHFQCCYRERHRNRRHPTAGTKIEKVKETERVKNEQFRKRTGEMKVDNRAIGWQAKCPFHARVAKYFDFSIKKCN